MIICVAVGDHELFGSSWLSGHYRYQWRPPGTRALYSQWRPPDFEAWRMHLRRLTFTKAAYDIIERDHVTWDGLQQLVLQTSILPP